MREPSGPPPAAELLPVLRQRRVEAIMADARFIRDHPPCIDKDDAGRRQVCDAMMQHAVGGITTKERDEILGILSFAVISMKRDATTDESEEADFPLTPDGR